MGARKVRPGTTKVSGLTPDQVRVLRDAAECSQLVGAGHVALTPTTATFSCGPATAAEAVRVAIMTRKKQGEETRPLYAVERKLMKQVRPGEKAQPVDPPAPRASKRLNPKDCDHRQREGDFRLTAGPAGSRVKCLCCGLIVDDTAPPAKPARPSSADRKAQSITKAGERLQRPARPGRGGVTTATVTQDAPEAPGLENGAQPHYVGVMNGDRYLVVMVRDGEDTGTLIAACPDKLTAKLITTALNTSPANERTP